MDAPEALTGAGAIEAAARARAPGLFGELLRRSSWLMLGSALGRALPLVLLIAAGRTLDSQQFANASMGFAWSGVAVSLAGAGIAITLTQRLAAAAPAQRPAIFGRHLRWALLLAAALAVAVLALGARAAVPLFGRAFAPGVVLPAIIAGLAWTICGVGVAALNGCHRARAASAVMALGGALQGLAMAVGWAVAAGGEAIVWGQACGSIGACAWSLYSVRRELGSSWHGRAPGPAWRPGGHLAIWRSPIVWNSVAAASILPASLYACSVVARAVGPGATRALAQYFALEQIHLLLVYAPVIVAQAALPLLAQRHAQGADAYARLARRLLAATWLSAALGVALAALLLWHPGWFVRLLANPALGPDDAWAIRWMGFNAALALMLSLSAGALVATGRIVMAALLNLGWAAAFVALTTADAAGGVEALQRARFVASCALGLVTTLSVLVLTRPRGAPPAPEAAP
ncbi:MAG: oligosaccharide flippase family protein [Gammaproteobacteria bacterium]|nr:oligosaccharide flippase family protein [Gammaproteobacteria bacterium]